MCEVESCEGTYYSKGYCRKHYEKWRRNGNPLGQRSRGVRNYFSAHRFLRNTYGSATEHDCSVCSNPADEWAFVKEWCPTPQEQDGRLYSQDPAHYLTLCKRHHYAYDTGLFPSFEVHDA